jgi:hypothetical protein
MTALERLILGHVFDAEAPKPSGRILLPGESGSNGDMIERRRSPHDEGPGCGNEKRWDCQQSAGPPGFFKALGSSSAISSSVRSSSSFRIVPAPAA